MHMVLSDILKFKEIKGLPQWVIQKKAQKNARKKRKAAFPPLATHAVTLKCWHAWQTDLRITKVRSYVMIYKDTVYQKSVHDEEPYDGILSFNLEPGTYNLRPGARHMSSTSLELVVDSDITLDVYIKPSKIAKVTVREKSTSAPLADVKVECANFVPKIVYTAISPDPNRGPLPFAIIDYGYDAYNKRVTVTFSKPGYDTISGRVDTSRESFKEEEEVLASLTPTGWEPPIPEYEHTRVETYPSTGDYEIHYFPTLFQYGVYLLPGESPPTGPVPLDEKWKTSTTIDGCRGIIDNLVGEPVFVQNYPPISPTHVDPGWKIYKQAAGAQLLWAVDAETLLPVSTTWPHDNLSGLLNWIDQTLVPTGTVRTYQGINITFYLEKMGLYHVYEAKVGAHTKRFDNWRLGDCRTWIDAELAEPEPELAVTFTASPTSGPAPLRVTLNQKMTGGVMPYSWTLDYGDGTGPIPGWGYTHETGTVYTYYKVGDWTAILIVTDDLGASVSKSINITTIAVEAKGSITSYDAPASANPGDTVTVSATAKNVGAGSGSFRLRLQDRDLNVDVDSTSWFTLAAGASTSKSLTGTMPDKDWNLKLLLERTLPTGAVAIDDEKKFTAINIANWWDAIRARWNSLKWWQKGIIIAGSAGGIVGGGTLLTKD